MPALTAQYLVIAYIDQELGNLPIGRLIWQGQYFDVYYLDQHIGKCRNISEGEQIITDFYSQKS